MNIKNYIEEQLNSGVDIEDILDNVQTAYYELNEEKMIDNQKKLDAQAITELELDFVKKYYPNIYNKYYESATIEELADEFIESLELASKGFYSSKELIDELFDSLT